MKRTETGDRIFLSYSPFSAAKWHGKNPDCQGFKGGDFFAAYKRKNTTRPLMVWIVGTYIWPFLLIRLRFYAILIVGFCAYLFSKAAQLLSTVGCAVFVDGSIYIL
jgi:hypothetical protein